MDEELASTEEEQINETSAKSTNEVNVPYDAGTSRRPAGPRHVTLENKLERRILELASHEIAHNRVINFRAFVPRVVKKITGSESALREALFNLYRDAKIVRVSHLIERLVGRLIAAGDIVEGRKIIPGLILEHPTRRQIHEIVRARPGSSMKALLKRTNCGTGTVYTHLRYLIEFDLVVYAYFIKRRYYFDADVPRAVHRHYIVARKTPYRRLLAVLAAEGAHSVVELARRLDKHHSTIQYLVTNLEKYHFVKSERTSGNTFVRVVPDSLRRLQEIQAKVAREDRLDPEKKS